MKRLILPLLLATPALADPQAIPEGASLTAAQAAHAFEAGCIASQPGLIERRAEIFETAFFFEPTDLGTDAGYVSPDGAISVTVDGNVLGTACEMSIVADIGGDGAELYESLDAHLPDAAQAVKPEAVDGGLAWSWAKSGVTYQLTFVEVEGAFLLTYTAER